MPHAIFHACVREKVFLLHLHLLSGAKIAPAVDVRYHGDVFLNSEKPDCSPQV